jgi:FixJ family two-component response regulator
MPDANSTVLVIDDDPDVRASVGRLLRSLGLDAHLFASIPGICFSGLMTEAGLSDDARKN